MRVKTFTADSTAAAMNLVRDALGADAIIVATRTERDGTACITAAIDPPLPANEDIEEPEAPVFPGETEATIRQAMTYHGVPPWLGRRLAKAATEVGATTAMEAFGEALARHFAFAELDAGVPTLLIGPAGSGKTVTVAKICTRDCLAKRPVAVVSADTRRAGGIEQLEAFTRILDIELVTAASPDELAGAVTELQGDGRRVLVDTPAANPLDEDEMAALGELIAAVGGRPVLTLAAGGDPMEAVDIARAYADLGAEHLIVTQMDMARRYGGLLAAAEGAGLTITDASISAQIADGLIPLTPLALARLMMPHIDPTRDPTRPTPESETSP